MAESVQRLRGTCFEVRSVKFVRNAQWSFRKDEEWSHKVQKEDQQNRRIYWFVLILDCL